MGILFNFIYNIYVYSFVLDPHFCGHFRYCAIKIIWKYVFRLIRVNFGAHKSLWIFIYSLVNHAYTYICVYIYKILY